MKNWIRHYYESLSNKLRNIFSNNRAVIDVEVKYDPIITKYTEEFGDHINITRPKLIRWISQFPDTYKDLSVKILESVRYYSTSNIQRMTNELVELVFEEFNENDPANIYFVTIGSAGDGAQTIARFLKSNQRIPNSRILDTFGLHQASKSSNIEVIIFVDDFSGTGQTITDWWQNVEPLILPIGAKISIGLIVLNSPANAELEKITNSIIQVDFLNDENNVLSAESNIFEEQEKTFLLEISGMTGCSDNYLRGRGECGLLIAFKHGCPNNSLPFLWHNRSGTWESLFSRRSN